MPADGGDAVIAAVPWWGWLAIGGAAVGLLSLAVVGVSHEPDRRLAEFTDPREEAHVEQALAVARTARCRPSLRAVRGSDRRG